MRHIVQPVGANASPEQGVKFAQLFLCEENFKFRRPRKLLASFSFCVCLIRANGTMVSLTRHSIFVNIFAAQAGRSYWMRFMAYLEESPGTPCFYRRMVAGNARRPQG